MPYPYWSDYFFIINSIAWVIGIGMIYNNASTWPKLALLPVIGVAVIGAFILFYVMLKERNWTLIPNLDPLKLFLDVFYPFLEIINVSLLSMAIFIRHPSDEQLVPKLRPVAIILTLGMFIDFIADLTFSITTTHNTYVNGRLPDFLFATAFFLLGVGIQLIPLQVNEDQTVEQEQESQVNS